jgi:hypothetical protein
MRFISFVYKHFVLNFMIFCRFISFYLISIIQIDLFSILFRIKSEAVTRNFKQIANFIVANDIELINKVSKTYWFIK